MSSTKTVKTSMTNPITSTLTPYMLTPISGMGISVITLTFDLSFQVNKKSTWSRHSDTTTPSASHSSNVKVTKIDTYSKPSTLLEVLPNAISKLWNVIKILIVEYDQYVINCRIRFRKNSFKLYRFRGNRSVS